MRTLGFQLPTIVMSDDESFVSVHCVAVMSTEYKLSPQDWKAVTMEQGESLFHSVLQQGTEPLSKQQCSKNTLPTKQNNSDGKSLYFLLMTYRFKHHLIIGWFTPNHSRITCLEIH